MLRLLPAVIVAIVAGACGAVSVLWLAVEPDATANSLAEVPARASQVQTSSLREQVSPPATVHSERLLSQFADASAERDLLAAQLLELELRLNKLTTIVEGLAAANSSPPVSAPTASAAVVEEAVTEEPASELQPYLDAGLDPLQVEDIAGRQADLEMRRLYLREQAAREGWLGSDRYAEAQRELDSIRQAIRQEVGENAYDRYLYASGQANRIRVSSIIRGSPAEQAGLVADDVIVSYGGQTILSYNDLTRAIREGDPGEAVRVAILRDQYDMAVTMPRGPLGVRLASVRLEPQ